MKKALLFSLFFVSALTLVIAGCSSTPKPDVEAAAPAGHVIADQSRIPSAVAKCFDYNDGSSTIVKIYQREMDQYPDHVVFKYVDVMNQALRYKKAHPDEDVAVRFAMYSLSPNICFYFDESDPKYGEITSESIPGHTENILESVVRLAKNGVKVDFVVQSNITSKMQPYFDESCIVDPSKKVSDFLAFHRVMWGGESEQQMHAKFITADKVLDDDGTEHFNVVYLASHNIDALYDNFYKSTQERAQTGVLIIGNQGIFDAFNMYQDMVGRNINDQKKFQEEVRASHAAKSLNYSDQYFRTHFTPVLSVIEPDPFSPDSYSPVTDKESAWDTENNVFAKYMEELANSDQGPRLFYANVYHYKTAYNDLFGWKIFKILRGLYFGGKYDNSEDTYLTAQQNADREAMKAKKLKPDSKSPLVTKWIIETSTSPHRFSNDTGFRKGMELISDGKALYYKADHKYLSHCKDVLLSYMKDGVRKYVVISGSTNLKRDGNANKANASVVILENEGEHSIFDTYKGFIDSIVDARK